MASSADAELILRLYEIRQEEALRRARKFMVFEFNPKNLEELRAVSRNPGSQENAYWRQAMSYWEMAASFVLRDSLDPELFCDSAAEGILLYAKFHHFHAVTEKESGNPFMRHTAQLVERFPAAQALHENFLRMFGQTK
jgi:hypothetical protein